MTRARDAVTSPETSGDPVAERLQVYDFLLREAELADNHEYGEWLALWQEGGRYLVPANEDDADPRHHIFIIFDDYKRLCDRIFRMSQPGSHSQEPRSRLCRVVGSVGAPRPAGDGTPGAMVVDSRYVLDEIRRGEVRRYSARQRHTLTRDADDTLKILSKEVFLTENDNPLFNLTFIL